MLHSSNRMLKQCRPTVFSSIVFVIHLTLTGTNSPQAVNKVPVVTNAPNILFVLTDDQDIYLGGQTPMKKTKALIGDAGIIFNNMFVTSPLCCPSRSSILTGKYIHNHNALNNSISGGCSSPAWQAGPEKHTFITDIKQRGHNTFFSGKYLNQYGKHTAGGVKHVPPGWDWWIGLVGNSRYYNYQLSVNGTKEHHGAVYKEDYLTDIIGRRAAEFLDQQNENTPFFMMLSTPACHAPFTPAPQYNANFSDLRAPRTPNYNIHGEDKHWLIRAAEHPMSENSQNISDSAFRKRWRTLLSVDDMVENLVTILREKQLLENSFIFFTGDNGFHLGQFSLPIDKRQLYEFDIRVPLMVRGPGITAGQVREELVLSIDLAPTFIDLTGGHPAPDIDGASIKPLLISNQDIKFSSPWLQDTFLVEYYGESDAVIPGCPQLDNQALANCQPDCVCEDAKNNTYHCIRRITAEDNIKYCELDDEESFVEFYDLHSDPFELKNRAAFLTPELKERYSRTLSLLSVCKGVSCHEQSYLSDLR